MIYTHKSLGTASLGVQDKARELSKQLLGVTLLELLITISIVMVLASLLVPIIGWVKQSTQQSTCQNNLRQLGAAVWIYAQLNGDRIPASRNFGTLKPTQSFAWFHKLPPLMSGRTVGLVY
jgi:type II secretory pathway pseudopilin PulG